MTAAVTANPPLTVDDVLAPMAVETFLTNICAKRWYHHRHGGSRFDQLLPWARLAGLLASGSVLPPRMILTDAKRNIPAAAYGELKGKWRQFEPDPVALSRHLNDGATVAVHQVDTLDPVIAELAADFERRLSVRVTGEAYASFHEQHAFITHWDPSDVLIMQVHGQKYWRIWEATRFHPLEVDTEWPDAPTGDPMWEGVVEAGDILYLPHGTWHDVVATSSGPSLHVSFFLERPTGIDLLKWMAEQAVDDPLFRQDLPVLGDETARRTHGSALAAAAQGLWSEDIVARYLAFRAATATPRAVVNLPWDAYPARVPDGGGIRLRGRPPYGGTVRDGDGCIELDALNKTWRFSPDATPLIPLIVDRRRHSVDEWYAVGAPLPPDRVRQFIGELLREGLLEAAEPPVR